LFTETLAIPSNDSANSSVIVTLKGAVKSLFFLPDTGQTQCYRAKGSDRVISPCPSPGDALAQDGSYTINPPSYTINGDGTVFDNNTWLMWQQEDDNITRTWDDANIYCENLSLGGYTDWRLPNVKELSSVINYGQSNPVIDSSVFVNTKADNYWSSSTTGTYVKTWRVNFGSGVDYWDSCEQKEYYESYVNYAEKYSPFYVRCVRGDELTFGNFRDNGNGTVTDLATWLTWQQDNGGTMNWGAALEYCEGLTLGGYSDWRLPNVKELESIVDNTRYNPTINTTYLSIPDIQGTYCPYEDVVELYYWSSTPTTRMDYPNRLSFSFRHGNDASFDKSYNNNLVRCVRGQQLPLIDNHEIRVDPSNMDFWYVKTGESKTLTLTVSNVNKGNLVIGTIVSPSTPFSIISDGCSGLTLGFSTSCSIIVKFTPITDGTFTDLISIPSNDADHPNLTVKLNGQANPFGVAFLLPDTGQTDCYNVNGDSILCPPPGNPAAQDGSYTMNPLSLTVNGDGTVFDNNTWLMWQQEDDNITRTWDDANIYCENLTLGGYSDWRLPTRKELFITSIFRGIRGESYEHFDSSVFLNTKSNSYYWSSTKKDTGQLYVRCVRGEQLSFGILVDNKDGTIMDLATGLTWQQGTTIVSDWGYALGYCEGLTLGGYTDWRLPNVKELKSLTDDSRYNPAFNPIFFIVSVEENCTDGWPYYWTSTNHQRPTYTNDSFDYAYTINRCNGGGGVHSKTTSNYSARCVRGGNMLPVITGMITDSLGIPLSFVTVTVTDSEKIYTVNASGSFTVSGLMPGSFTATFEKSGYIKQIVSGTLAMSETKMLNIQLVPIPPLTLAITSPPNGAVVNSSPITVAGTVTNNAQVTVNGIQATVSSNTFSATVPLNEGLNTITATATDSYEQTVTQSITVTFVPPPIISDITVSNITASSATITWTTNQMSDSLVEYGVTTSYGSSVSDSTLTINHSITLTDLVPLTTYHFRVTSKNSYGFSSSSGDVLFTTLQFTVTTLGDYGNVTVMEVTGNYDAKNPDGSINTLPRQEIAKEFFRAHADTYDFIVIFANFDFQMPEADAKAFYLEVKNDTQGIGKLLFDDSNLFGSNGKLQGIIDMGNISVHPIDLTDPRFEDTISDLAHEQMHRWGANVRFRDSNGATSTALLGKGGNHWSFLLDSEGSVLYGNDWKDNGNGTFTSIGANKYYSPLDLYLMGFYDKSQVLPMLLIENTIIDPTQLPSAGATITGTQRYVTIDDIIAIEGERIPNASTSQKTFKTAFILLTRPGTFTGSEPAGIENVRNAYAGEFASLTNGKGSISDVTPSITIAIASPSNNETINKPYVTVKGAIINTTGNETGVAVNGIVATTYGNQFIANHIPLTEGSNTITVTATDTAGNTATTSIVVNAVTTGNYIQLTANPESGISPLEATLKIDGSFSITNSTITYTGPAQPEFLFSSADEYRVRMTVEGIYYVTASVTGPDSNVYQDTVAIIVLNSAQLDALLRAKWEAMKTALANQDINSAVNYYTEETKQHYNDIFTTLYTQLPQITQNMQNIQMIYAKDNTAKYRIKTSEVHAGQTYDITYYIYFVVDENGIWKIHRY
jgi:hypothetical protein